MSNRSADVQSTVLRRQLQLLISAVGSAGTIKGTLSKDHAQRTTASEVNSDRMTILLMSRHQHAPNQGTTQRHGGYWKAVQCGLHFANDFGGHDARNAEAAIL